MHSWFVKQTQHRFGVALQEAMLTSDKAVSYLSGLLGVNLGNQFIIDLPSAESTYTKQARLYSSLRPVRLNAYSHDDLDMLANFGLKCMQNARLFRIIEEASYQGAHPTYQHLCLLLTITAKSIRERLIPLWEEGITLPVAATDKKHRTCRQLRPVYVLNNHIAGTSLKKLQQQLCFSDRQWEIWVLQFLSVCITGEHFAVIGKLPAVLDGEYRHLYESVKNTTAFAHFLSSYRYILPCSTVLTHPFEIV